MYILYIYSIKTMFQIFSSYKINGTKNENALFFSFVSSHSSVLLLICGSYMS